MLPCTMGVVLVGLLALEFTLFTSGPAVAGSATNIDSKPTWIPLIRYRSTWNPELKAPFPSQAQRSQQLSPLETKWLWMKELGVVALTYYIYTAP